MVRAAPDQEQRRTARISLIWAIGAGAAMIAIWLYMKEPPREIPKQRTLSTYPVLWVCENNPQHTFIANGRFEPLPCRECDGRCYIQLEYVCPEHGEFHVFAQFQRIESDESAPNFSGERISKYRYDVNSPWQTCENEKIPCPEMNCSANTRQSTNSWTPRRRNNSGSAESH